MAIGCALLLVSLIPPARLESMEFYAPFPIMGKTWLTSISRVLTPQEELSINIRVNGTMRAYLLETSPQAITEWISKRISEDMGKIRREEYFLEFLEANPHLKVMEEIIVSEVTLEYTPAKITSITLVLHNPNPNPVELRIKASLSRTMAPRARVRSVSQIVIPLGFALTMPRIMVTLQSQMRKKSNKLDKLGC